MTMLIWADLLWAQCWILRESVFFIDFPLYLCLVMLDIHLTLQYHPHWREAPM